MSKFYETAEKIEEALVGSYKKVEDAAVSGYKKVEDAAVSGFNKVADQFVDAFLTRDGESVEEARERLAQAQQTRQEQQKARIEESLEVSRNAGKRN